MIQKFSPLKYTQQLEIQEPAAIFPKIPDFWFSGEFIKEKQNRCNANFKSF